MIEEEISVLSAEKEFKILIKRKILIRKNCCLLTDLVEKMANVYEIYCVEGKVNDNKKMKSFLLTNFRDNSQFTPAHGIHGNPIIVHLFKINLVDYAMALIIGAGLRDKEITLAFTKMISDKLMSEELSKNFPLSAKNLMINIQLKKF